ncbi:hypothetical protein F5Y19DRAFT_391394 [Xylariaceae sp. FL1651]|nr:hypothetical protein F5Y19DRAFT_391394 [Xylariaceae sp. FL1651]
MNLSSSSTFSDLLAIASSSLPSSSTLLSSLSSWKQYIIPAAIGYVALCRMLRFRGEKNLRRRMGYPEGCGREALARMTNDEAQQIIKYLAAYEFPEFHLMALQFGLFKTYGVESISRLLLATRNLTDPIKSLKRYEDTAAMIGEFMINPPTSERAIRAIARMNFLHSKYREEGTISNEDLLYTLSVFVIEPPRFARLYEWRALNEMEYCAYGVFWKAVGDAMGIEYKGLLAHDSWLDGIEWADDITAWAKAYEADVMKPSVVANKPARALIPMITYWVPWFAKPFSEEAVCVLMGDRVREAFMLPEPGIVAGATVYSLLLFRRLLLRYLTLPRIYEVHRLGDADPKTGRMHSRFAYGNYPYYIKPTVWNRWGPKAWAIWLYGGKLPGDNPEEHMPQGYLWSDLGPKNRMGLGAEEMEVDVQRMKTTGRGGCPF